MILFWRQGGRPAQGRQAGLEGHRGVSRRRLGRLATRLTPDLRLLLLPERLPFVGTRSKLRPHLVLHHQQQLVEGPLRGAGVVAGGGWRAPASQAVPPLPRPSIQPAAKGRIIRGVCS